MTQTTMPMKRTGVLINRRWTVVAASTVAVAALITAALWSATSSQGQAVAGSWYEISPRTVEVRLIRDGELQAVENIELMSEVEGNATIQFIVKEGAQVSKGDVLIELDSAGIRQRIEDTTLEVQKAEADVTTSRELLEIQKSQNSANLEAAEVQLAVAGLDLKQYTDGTYPQTLSTVTNRVEMARIDLGNKEADFVQVKSLASKGYLTATDVKTREIDLIKARNALSEAETELRVLTGYKHDRDLTQFRSALAQAEQRLIRVQRENTANLSQRDVDLSAKEQALAIKKRQLEKLQSQLIACTIKAPADGMVVYATSNDRNAQSMIQEGAQVRERQVILRLPDTSSMKVVMRVPEASVSRLREGMRASVTLPSLKQSISGSLVRISPLADSGSRWWNPDLREFPVDVVLDDTPQGLRPGLGANVEVQIARHDDVLAVPLTSLYTQGRQSFVFVRLGETGVKATEVKLGDVSDTHAVVLSGLTAGTEIRVLEAGEGRAMLDSAVRAGEVKLDQPSTRPSGRERPAGGERPAAGGANATGSSAGRGSKEKASAQAQ